MVRRTLFALVAGSILVGGCSDDKSTTGPVIVETPDFATTKDKLIEHFTMAWVERNFVAYDEMVHEDFVFYFAPADVSLSPFGQGFWERAFEVDSTSRLFSGEQGLRPDGSVQSGVKSIHLNLTPLQPDWTDASGEGAEFVGTFKRRYEVDMTVDYAAGNLISEVTGEQVFYVKAMPTDIGGETVDVFQLVYWRDLGRPLGKHTETGRSIAVESATWGAVKSLF